MTCFKKDSYEINTEKAMSIIMGGGISQSMLKKKKKQWHKSNLGSLLKFRLSDPTPDILNLSVWCPGITS